MAYAIVDAPGSFDSAGRGSSWVYSSHKSESAAVRAARKLRQVQVICCDLPKGASVYEDAVDRVYRSVWRAGDE